MLFSRRLADTQKKLIGAPRSFRTRPAKAYAARVTAVIILFFIGVGLFNAVIDPYGLYDLFTIPGINAYKSEARYNEKLYKALAARRAQPSAIALGSSDVDMGISMLHAGWSGTPGSRYNLGFVAASLGQVLQFLKYSENIHKLTHVVIGIGFEQFYVPLQADSGFDWGMLKSHAPVIRFFKIDLPLLLDGDVVSASLRTIAMQPSQAHVERIGLQQEKAGAAILLATARRWLTHPGQIGGATDDARYRTGQSEYLADGQRQGSFVRRNADFAPARATPREWMLQVENRTISRQISPQAKADRSENQEEFYRDLRRIIRFCEAHRIDLRFFISPMHARLVAAEETLGLGPAVDDWKQTLVRILAEEAARAGAARSAPLFDFSGYSSVTTEDLPPPGSRQGMKFFWDELHYKDNVGGWVLDRVLGVARPANPPPDDFGILLTPENVVESLARMRSAGKLYRQSHPEDLFEIEREITRATALAQTAAVTTP